MTRTPDRELRANDERARQRTQQEFTRPLVLEAGAGTGKTAALVARVLAWSLGPGWIRAETALAERAASAADPRAQASEETHADERLAARVLSRIVCITFTEAAAAEMGLRIARALLEVERGEHPIGVFDDALPAEPDRRRRARALRGALDHLVVQTIHAYCRHLLLAHPLEAGVHPRLEVDARGLVQAEVVREVLEARLREAYADPGDPALLALARAGYGPAAIEAELGALLDEGVPTSALDADPLAPESVVALLQRLRDAVALLDGLCAERGGALKRARRSIEVLEALGLCRDRLDASFADGPAGRIELRALCKRFSSLWPETNRTRLKDWGNGRFGREEQTAFEGCQEEIAHAAGPLAELLDHVVGLDPERLETARPVFRALLAEVESRLRDRGAITFAGLLRQASQLLTDRVDVARRVRSRIDQLLVDEFQDTDRRQCAIVRAIALEGDDDERPGLFLVGDPKQSIYGWRSADLAAYDAFVGDVLAAGGSLERLSVNHRSAPPILEEVEHVVAPVMQVEEGVQPAFQPLVPSDANREETGFREDRFAPVEYWIAAGAEGEGKLGAAEAARMEAEALARDLRRLHEERGVAWAELGVLFRSRGEWEIYLGALRRAEIPFMVEGDRSYYQRREIIEASALVCCVLDPNDHLALLTVLRSAAVGVPDAALIPLWARRLPGRLSALDGPDAEALAELRRAAGEVAAALRSGAGDVPGLARVAGWEESLGVALRAIALLRRSFAEDPSDVFVERLRTLLLVEAGEAARHLGAWRCANLERFFRELTDALEETADPHAVVRRLRAAVVHEERDEEGRPKEILEDAVAVMTIHGAKGLDFAHVYVMQLHKSAGDRPSGTIQSGELEGVFEYRLLGAATPGWDRVARERARVATAELVRSLYVAMTRARSRLVMAGCWTPFQSRSGRGRHVDLLDAREPSPPDLRALREELARDASSFSDAAGARWVFPGLESVAASTAADRVVSSRADPFELEAARSAAGRLAELRRSARARMQRPFGAPASGEAHHDQGETWAEGRGGRAETSVAPGTARLVGTAIHQALEDLDPAAPPEAELERLRAGLAASLRSLATSEQFEAALAAAEALLERVGRGKLFARLREIGADVVARELPALLAPATDEGATGFVAGAIDLVYRDRASDELVVVDYKTDRVSGDEIEPRAGLYAAQGAIYGRALREAFDLAYTPRCELWFLAADRIVVV